MALVLDSKVISWLSIELQRIPIHIFGYLNHDVKINALQLPDANLEYFIQNSRLHLQGSCLIPIKKFIYLSTQILIIFTRY